MSVAPVEERFGPYGGRFVPETLIAALDELSAAWAKAREDKGFQIELATMKLQVAEVCNGLRFLLAILVLTAAFGHVLLPSWQRKTILVVSAGVIAIIANAFRVAAIGIGVHYIGPEAASGTVHNWIGKGVWAMTLIPLALLTIGLARFHRPRRQSAEDMGALAARKAGLA